MVEAGTEVALRDVWFGRVWRATAARVVSVAPELVVLWIPTGTPARYPVDEAGAEVRLPRAGPALAVRVAESDFLVLERMEARHSIWLMWDPPGALSQWYVNFERPLGWNGTCFDSVDEKLDLIVTPDGAYRWKDEDELEHAAAAGLVDADAVRAEGERVVAEWPFPTGWEDFRPDPGWPVPQLPRDWARPAV